MRSSGAFLAVSVIVLSCSSSSSTPSPADDPTNCGPGPYGKVKGTLFEATLDNTEKRKPDANITFDLCPNKTFTTGADGSFTVNMTKNKPMITTIDHPDDVPQTLAEWQLEVDEYEANVSCIPKLFRAVIAPEFNADNSVLGLGVFYPRGTFDAGVPDGGPTDPCQRSEGVSFQIPGHAEAKVTYYTAPPSGMIPAPDTAATMTSTNGLAKVNGLPEDTFFEVTASKPGCTLNGKHDGFTGRAKLQKGFVTTMFIQMTK